ncbi:hypothetical protein A2764_01880 [Candidatus Kaiserbacteria bacterium RIFCSPHIGHO2_01_FULL_55_79]|nr:MAG: hypothetical protein A2764_01880 [Candidatus Kaiserbacteria bacterium RIFCSPHIGHO2_01_FULL_55_79]OGG78105.1 MAG: hypothetical protein A3F56_03620 [Candidatus Kaiserbacteria bacterium RIFCSPHIGHO2_12_FULL_55_13]OGG83929.1 MAG: hypothetical protein A3A42_00330 [Candidatus Kaiserbacteria bacterium RIFCSPLOWO2_01_FULL_55_25]
MMKRSYIVLTGAVVAVVLIGGAIVLTRNSSPVTSTEKPHVVPPIENRVTTLDALGENGANASTSVQTSEKKLQVLETLSEQNASSQNTTTSSSQPTTGSSSAAPDTSEKLNVLQSMRGQ